MSKLKTIISLYLLFIFILHSDLKFADGFYFLVFLYCDICFEKVCIHYLIFYFEGKVYHLAVSNFCCLFGYLSKKILGGIFLE